VIQKAATHIARRAVELDLVPGYDSLSDPHRQTPFTNTWTLMDCAVNNKNPPEMIGDMSRVTLNFDLSKIPFVRF